MSASDGRIDGNRKTGNDEEFIASGAMSPLANPVVEEIFKSEATGGLAAGSFIGAVLAECGETFGTIVKLSPEYRQSQLGNRRSIVDVRAESDTGRIASEEVQLYFEPSIFERNLLAASYSFVDAARIGASSSEMASEMPKVSAINILGHIDNCRSDNREILQPISFRYDKEPCVVAADEFAAYNIQLPYFPEAAEDYDNPLYCWCKLFYEMHYNHRFPEEVCSMEPKIKAFVEGDAGASQYVSRYSEVTADATVKQAYRDWVLADFRERGIIRGAQLQASRAIAKKLLAQGDAVEKISEATGLTAEQIEALR